MRTIISSLLICTAAFADDTITINDAQFQDAISFLGKLVEIPSVSNPHSPDYNQLQLNHAARMVEDKLLAIGMKASCVSIEGAAPYVVGELIVDPSKPTILLYSHYDVQPVDRQKWTGNPFSMQERDGRLYGRGASDDKGGIVAIIAAIDTYKQAAGELPVNIKVFFEGEEEYGGSAHMKYFLQQYGDTMNADALIIMDGGNISTDIGTLTSSTRGTVNIKLKVNALNKPFHSGVGCLAPDPAQALAGIISSLKDLPQLDAFNEGTQELNPQERVILAQSSQTAESYAREVGIVPGAELRGDPDVSIYERIVLEPSISVLNMHCGQPNGGNSIQDSASCTIGIRILPGQEPQKVTDTVINYIKSQPVMYNLPIEIAQEGGGSWAWKANLTGPYSLKYLEALKENFATSGALPTGGALPLLKDFQNAFPNMEMIIAGVEDPHSSIHSHNESQDIETLRKSINSLITFFNKASQ